MCLFWYPDFFKSFLILLLAMNKILPLTLKCVVYSFWLCRTTWARCLHTMQPWYLILLEHRRLSSLDRASWLFCWAIIDLLAPYLLLLTSELLFPFILRCLSPLIIIYNYDNFVVYPIFMAMQEKSTTKAGFVSRSLSYLHAILWGFWRDIHKSLGFVAGNFWKISLVFEMLPIWYFYSLFADTIYIQTFKHSNIQSCIGLYLCMQYLPLVYTNA